MLTLNNIEIPILYPRPYYKGLAVEYGTYLVVRKDGKKHFETFNNTGWAYNQNEIIAYYLPKI